MSNNASNASKLAKCGLADYHAAGLDGRGMRVAVLDERPYIRPTMDREIFSAPLDEGREATHASNVAQVVHEAAPGAQVIMLPFMSTSDRQAAIAWLQNNPVDIINISLNLATADEFWPDFQALNTPIVAAAGNKGPDTEDCAKPARYGWTLAVGGYLEGAEAVYSDNSCGDSMDCVAYTNILLESKPGYLVPFGGTSAAAPWLCGMLACLFTGHKIPAVEVLRVVIRANCRDVAEPGKDRSSGWGLFVMPPLSEWREDLPKFCRPADKPQEPSQKKIVLHLGSSTAEVDGRAVTLDCAPRAEAGRTLVPLRFVAEALGCRVDYAAGQITITK